GGGNRAVRRSGFARQQLWQRRRGQGGSTIASTVTVMLHGGVALALIFSRQGPPKVAPTVYRVELVAAPLPELGDKKASEAPEREPFAPCGGSVPGPSRRIGDRTPVHQAVRQFCVRSRSAGCR